MDYLYYSEIQKKLNRYMEQHGAPCTLTHAIRTLRQDGIIHRGEALPKVSFSEWNIQDLDQFDRLIDQTGFPISAVVSDLPGEQTKSMADPGKPELEILPGKKFENQAPGERSLGSFGISNSEEIQNSMDFIYIMYYFTVNVNPLLYLLYYA